MARAWRMVAILFSLLALLFGYFLLEVRWAPRIDFDVIGFLWLLENMAPLSLVLLFGTCLFAAVYFWIRYWSESR